ncbi:MAG: nitrous oxide-stimulated promoter family protein [Desulfotomaculum sp.]|nr:nitrous oxide-stimulated promoter family protein [Desulfotomaculum sp.]
MFRRNTYKDVEVLLKFIETYCIYHHKNQSKTKIQNKQVELCPTCSQLAVYAAKRLMLCPKDPKPSCKKCDIHCYAPQYREQVKKVMKFSGIHFIKKGRIDYLIHYFF